MNSHLFFWLESTLGREREIESVLKARHNRMWD